MKNKIALISLIDISNIGKDLASEFNYIFTDVFELVKFDLVNIDVVLQKNGVEYYNEQVTKNLSMALSFEKAITFINFDIAHNNKDVLKNSDVFKVYLHFDYAFLSKSNKLSNIPMHLQEKINDIKNISNDIIDCNNFSSKDIINILKGIINEK